MIPYRFWKCQIHIYIHFPGDLLFCFPHLFNISLIPPNPFSPPPPQESGEKIYWKLFFVFSHSLPGPSSHFFFFFFFSFWKPNFLKKSNCLCAHIFKKENKNLKGFLKQKKKNYGYWCSFELLLFWRLDLCPPICTLFFFFFFFFFFLWGYLSYTFAYMTQHKTFFQPLYILPFQFFFFFFFFLKEKCLFSEILKKKKKKKKEYIYIYISLYM